jgi:hypothetical protein
MSRSIRQRLAARTRGAAWRLALGTLLTALVGAMFPILSAPAAHAWTGGSITFTTAGTCSHQWTVPSGVNAVHFDVRAAQGGGGQGGLGGRVTGSLAVTPGTLLKVCVGSRPSNNAAGVPGGGAGRATPLSWGGGGYSSIGTGTTDVKVVVAGAGGGKSNTGNFGGRGGVVAADGGGFNRGMGATTTSPGAGGAGDAPGGTGGSLQGGNGAEAGSSVAAGGGGGGGGFGGGGGGASLTPSAGGGGGGSSWVANGAVTNATYFDGFQSGSGSVTLHWGNNEAPAAPTLSSPANNARLLSTQSQTFSMTTSDPEGNDWKGTVTVRNAANVIVNTFETNTVASGATATGTPTATIGAGSYTWSATATDTHEWGSSTSASSASRNLVINGPPSTPTQHSPTAGHTYNPGDPQTFSVSASDPNNDSYVATVEVSDGAGAVVSTFNLPSTASGSTASGQPPTALGPGSYSWRARASDGFEVGGWSSSSPFVVAGPRGNVAASPPTQVHPVGEEAAIDITVTDANGNPITASPISVSRTGANPQQAETFHTNGSGVYAYRYFGANVGVDAVQIASGNGGTAQVTVEWLPRAEGLDYPSDDCTTGNVVSGYVGDTYVRVRTQADPTDPGKQWVCVVGQDGSAHHGGKVVLGAAPGSVNPDVGVDATQADAESCLPIGQRVQEGTFAGGNPFFVDMAPNPDGSAGAWVCVRVAGVFLRLRAAADAPVTANFQADSPTLHPPYTEDAMTGLHSGTCQAAGGTRHLNLKVGDQQVALYTHEDDTRTDMCVRAGPQGARVSVDSGATPAPDYETGTNRDSSCPWDLITLGGGTAAVWMVDPLNPQLPAGVCVTVLGSTQRVTVTLGDGEGEAVDVDQDPA